MNHPHFVHNEYFGRADNRNICDCKSKGLQIYFWGGYLGRIYHHLKFFCPKCYEEIVKKNLITQHEVSGCQINIKGFRGERLPEFLLELHDILNGKPQLRLLKEQDNDKSSNLLSFSSRKKIKTSISFFKESKNLLLFEM